MEHKGAAERCASSSFHRRKDDACVTWSVREYAAIAMSDRGGLAWNRGLQMTVVTRDCRARRCAPSPYTRSYLLVSARHTRTLRYPHTRLGKG